MSGFALRKHVTATGSGDGMVLLDQRTGTYWQLNATAAQTLTALLDGATTAQAAAALARRHPGATGRAERDVAALVRELRAASLLAEERR